MEGTQGMLEAIEEEWLGNYPRRFEGGTPGPRAALDVVEVAGCCDMQGIETLLKEEFPEVAPLIDGSSDFWRARERWEGLPLLTSLRMRSSIQKLLGWGVLQEAQKREVQERMFITYFEVLKGDRVSARAIANCKAMNALFRTAVRFRLGTTEEVFRVVAWFSRGAFATADLRHWFHQLTLPQGVRGLFTLQVGEEVFEWKTWPMGFRYTPLVAQSIVVACIKRALRRCAVQPDVSSEEGPDTVVVGRLRGRTVALAMVWYDNILLATDTRNRCEHWIRALQKVFHELRITVKEPGFTRSQGEVSFLGVDFSPRSGSVTWSHVNSNIERWRERLSKSTVGLALSGKEWLQHIGICIWHTTLLGSKYSELSKVCGYVANQVGVGQLDEDWEKRFCCSEAIGQYLDERAKGVLGNQGFQRRVHRVPSRPIWVYTDASNWGLAALVEEESTSGLIIQREWSIAETSLHINNKEELAVLEALAWVESRGNPCSIIVGVDNRTAIARLRRVIRFGENGQVVLERLRDKGYFILIVWIPSAENPADGPSRGGSVPTAGSLKQARVRLEAGWKSIWYRDDQGKAKREGED